MEEEIYKVWYNGPRVIWEVSNYGNVKKNGILYECKFDGGYKFFGPYHRVHRVVAKLFVPNPENKPCVDHINGNPLDNKATNLRWVTPKENSNNPITKRRQSESKKGRTRSEESKRKQSEAMKRNQNAKGKIYGPQSEEHRKHRSEAMKDKYKNGYVNPMYGKPGPNKNKHRVNHDDGTYHYEKKLKMS